MELLESISESSMLLYGLECFIFESADLFDCSLLFHFLLLDLDCHILSGVGLLASQSLLDIQLLLHLCELLL